MRFKTLLERVTSLFHENGFFPIVATEIEFYLHGACHETALSSFKKALYSRFESENFLIVPLQKEDGKEQFELALAYCASPVEAAKQCCHVQDWVTQSAQLHGLIADFSAKPFDDQPGSGLHVHVHVENADGLNLFTRDAKDNYSPALLHAIGGMLAAMKESMVFFAPTESSYRRFQQTSNAPSTISWGPNNRTVALRLPAKPLQHKHVEHRVAGADADPYAVTTAILTAIFYGMSQKADCGNPTYGNASLPIYALEHLPTTLETAQHAFAKRHILSRYLNF